MLSGFELYPRWVPLTWETFRFQDENDYEYEIWREVFSRILKI